MSVKDVFKSLAQPERDCLMCAFQAGVPKHIELEGGRFIGVNVQYIQYLEPEETEGVWSIGFVKGQRCNS